MRLKKTDFNKRYRHKVASKFVIAVSAVIIGSLVIISYLGNLTGNYTIKLNRDNRQLTLADNSQFNNSSTRLRCDKIENAYPCTLDELPDDSELDKDNSASHNGTAGKEQGQYLAYTFYMKNSGTVTLNYTLAINIDKTDQAHMIGSTLTLDEILRVMLYENTFSTEESGIADLTHNKKIYAKKSNTAKTLITDSHGQIIVDEECSSRYSKDYLTCEGTRAPERAVPFRDDKKIIYYTNSIDVKEIIRYTVVMWFEGYDPDCNGTPPVGAGIALSMDLTGVES